MKHVIRNEFIRAEIDEQGAELTSVVACSREWIWQNADGTWAGHSPVLFPYGGCVHVMVDGKEYPLKKHGFASGSMFACTDKGETFVKLSLSANAQTLALFPYRFALEICYEVQGNALKINYRVQNLDEKPMYFSYGGHESFQLDEQTDYQLQFPQQEEFSALCHDEEGMLNGKTNHLGNGTTLALKAEYLANGNTLIFGNLHSDSVKLCTKEGKKLAQSTFEGIKNLLIWSPSPTKVVCIEPWYNLPDTVTDARDFSQKGFIRVDVGKWVCVARAIEYFK